MKITNYKLQITKFFLLFFIIYNLAFIIPVEAADSTPSADIRTKLEQLKAEIASKAAQLKQEVNQKLQNRIYVGAIQSKSISTLNLSTKEGSKTVSTNVDTVYQDLTKSKKALDFGGLKQEATVAALGDLDDTGVLTAREVLLLPTTSSTPKVHLWGQVLSASNGMISLLDKSSKNLEASFDIDTTFKKGADEISSSAVRKGDFVIVSGLSGKDGVTEASFVFVIPEGAALKPKLASPSASAKPKQ